MKTKSNAPWILGIVGFALSLPQVVCSILCAGAAAEAASTSGTGQEVAAATGVVYMMPVFCTIVCFILSFFGKSKSSTFTGVLLVLLGLLDVFACAINISGLGIAAAVCFFCSGISSICNAKKPLE